MIISIFYTESLRVDWQPIDPYTLANHQSKLTNYRLVQRQQNAKNLISKTVN